MIVDTRFYCKAAMDLPSKNHGVVMSFKTRTRTNSVRFRKDVRKIFRKGGWGVPWRFLGSRECPGPSCDHAHAASRRIWPHMCAYMAIAGRRANRENVP